MSKKFSRRLQVSNRSFIMTLPMEFIKGFNLKKGDLLTVLINSDRSLKIIPESLYEETDDSIEIDFYPEIGKEILEKCLSGTKRIRILSDRPISKQQLTQIRYYVNKLPNTMITIEKSQEIIIQNFGVKDFPSEEILRGIFSKTLDIFNNVKEKDNQEKEYNIEEIKKSYMLFIQYIRTYLTKGFLHPKDYKGFNFKKASDYREISNCIRDIAFILYDLDFFKEGLSYFNKIERYFRDAFDSFLFDQDKKTAYKLFFKDLWSEGEELRNKSEGNVRYMIKDLLKIFHKTSNILSIITILD